MHTATDRRKEGDRTQGSMNKQSKSPLKLLPPKSRCRYKKLGNVAEPCPICSFPFGVFFPSWILPFICAALQSRCGSFCLFTQFSLSQMAQGNKALSGWVGGRASIYSLDVAFSVFNFGEPLSFVYLEIISDLQKRNKNKTQGLLSNLHADLPTLHILVRFFFPHHLFLHIYIFLHSLFLCHIWRVFCLPVIQGLLLLNNVLL